MGVRAMALLKWLVVAAIFVAVLLPPGVSTVGCRDAPTIPSGARVFPAPPSYAAWWTDVETCSGLTGDLTRVTWVEVPCVEGAAGFPCEVQERGLCGGEWYPPHTIWLGGPNRAVPAGYAADEWTVKHEMLHDLTGSAAHGSVFGDCGVALR